jgi:hypothetical protein
MPGPAVDTNQSSASVWVPETEAERKAIHEQLERILASPLFKNSRRYPNLLRYVVERSLEGHTGHVKERTLGIEVFGRDPDYDTNLDPVVRTSAVEIRKRIAQYYHEPGHETEIRIDFPAGTYLPEFRLPLKPAVAPPSRNWPLSRASPRSTTLRRCLESHRSKMNRQKISPRACASGVEREPPRRFAMNAAIVDTDVVSMLFKGDTTPGQSRTVCQMGRGFSLPREKGVRAFSASNW